MSHWPATGINESNTRKRNDFALTLTNADFSQLRTYIKTNYGIDLSKKKQLIVSRLSNTLASRGYRSSSEYVDRILTGRDKEMITSMLNKLTTNYMHFLREEAHFQFLQNMVLPDLAKKHVRDKTLSIWSTGYPSGEEPHTVSMCLKEFFGSQTNSWNARMLATDIPQQILDRTRNPVYREESLEHFSSSWKQKYFVKNRDNTYTIAPVIKQDVILQTLNPINPVRFRRLSDLILCRNAMIYSGQATRDALVQCFYDTIVPGGYLLISHSGGLNKATCPYEYLMPVIYQETRR